MYAGTSGFAYPGWSPRFYPEGLRGDALLAHYAGRLPAVELNNTFYQQPSAAKVAAWLAATPPDFRFAVKAQRGGTFRSFAAEPEAGMPWLTGPYRAFGERLGAVLFRIPDKVRRDDDRLSRLLAAWPSDMPLVLELPDPSWADDDVTRAVAAAGATICITERPEDEEPPIIRRTSDRLYLRLRRHDYDAAAIDAWAARLEPFLADGVDAFVFFRHDEVGQGPEFALALIDAVARRR